MNSYQRLKKKYEARIAKLEDDINTLISEPDGEKAFRIKVRHEFKKDLQDAHFFGDMLSRPSSFDNTTGLTRYIKPE